ncbi:MAG: hypothetical protein V3U83_06925 [Acidobacteriota bacterium]
MRIRVEKFFVMARNELIVHRAGAILRASIQHKHLDAFGYFFTLNPSFVAGAIPKRLWCL